MTTSHIPSDFHGACSWQSPSNIALVKYWGKRAPQLPMNPSVSLTLSECRTVMRTVFEASTRFELSFTFDGKLNEAFSAKIRSFLEENRPLMPFLDGLSLSIDSRNTFPHSSGIASSASSMSALAMTLLDIEHRLTGCDIDITKASRIARMASGSASRSVIDKVALWGRTEQCPTSSDEYAIDIHNEVDTVFCTYRDTILLVSNENKKVSSSAGHGLMDTNPYASVRYNEARHNVARLLAAMKGGDLQTFVQVVEAEAMQLHAMMMCSTPSYMLIKPDTLHIIAMVRRFREDTGIPVCFTLDAGPNVHLLYPDACHDDVLSFINGCLMAELPDLKHIDDKVGNGTSRI